MPKQSRGKALPSQLPFPVVGLGASAGGIEALKEFFEALPASTGAAYVIVLHLSPDHASNLSAMLQPVTAMPVTQVTSTTHIEANNVYVIAPSLSLTMEDDTLHVSPGSGREIPRSAIDLFFRSLAEAHRERAVCIVLSGAGADGSVGMTRIKELGGLTFAQTPSEAEYTSMPRAAIDTGVVDFTLGASEIPQRLLELWANARDIRLPHDLVNPEIIDADAETNERALREIMIMLRTRTAHDFRHYKRATVLRRIERRLQVHGLAELQQYRDYLHLHPEETATLLQDMLISVTNFFRDKEAYEALRSTVLPLIFRDRDNNEAVRTWTAGCATGEEAYSMAILLNEASALTPDQTPFQIFATDIDERAISSARDGIYP